MHTSASELLILEVEIFDTVERASQVHQALLQSIQSSPTVRSAHEMAVLVRDDLGRLVFAGDVVDHAVCQESISLLELLIQCILFPSVWLVIGAADRALLEKMALAWPDPLLMERLLKSVSAGESALFLLVPEPEQMNALRRGQEFGGEIHHIPLSAQLVDALRRLSGAMSS